MEEGVEESLRSVVLGCAVAGCNTFLVSEAYIRQCPLPLAIYPLRTCIGALFHLSVGMAVLIVVCCSMRGCISFCLVAARANSPI